MECESCELLRASMDKMNKSIELKDGYIDGLLDDSDLAWNNNRKNLMLINKQNMEINDLVSDKKFLNLTNWLLLGFVLFLLLIIFILVLSV